MTEQGKVTVRGLAKFLAFLCLFKVGLAMILFNLSLTYETWSFAAVMIVLVSAWMLHGAYRSYQGMMKAADLLK